MKLNSKIHILQVLTLVLIFCSCQKVKEKSGHLIYSGKTKAIEVTKKGVRKSFDVAVNALSYSEDYSVEKLFKNDQFPEIKNLDGQKLNIPPNFYNYLFKYNANIDNVLKFLSARNTSLP